MRRNKLFLAMSLLVTTSALTEARAHGGRWAGHEAASGENNHFMMSRVSENRGHRRGGWRRFFMSHTTGGSSQAMVWPTAEADSVKTTVDTATSIDLLGNDTGTGLKIKSLYENTQAGGTTSMSGGVVTYTPPVGFTGTDEFWYVVSDADGRTNAAMVTIEIDGTATTDVTTDITTDVTNQESTDETEISEFDAFVNAATQAENDAQEIGVTDPEITDITLNETVVTDTAIAASTVGIKCEYDEDAYNDSPSVAANSTSTWSCDESVRNITANGIPDHAVGTFPSTENDANPNAITEQAVSASFTLSPTKTDTMTTPDVIGYALNGVKFDAVTTGSCNFTGDECSLTDNSGIWSIEAPVQARTESVNITELENGIEPENGTESESESKFDFGSDENNGYVQADGAYRYHGMPEGFLKNQGASDAVMTLIGWAADGFPIYGRHGHSDADDVESDLKAMTGSYQIVENAEGVRPSIETYALGTFTQDWQYVEGSGDLDECNGRTGVTPEFPNGIYHYFATDSYPYIPRCVKGEVEGQADEQIEVPVEEQIDDQIEEQISVPVDGQIDDQLEEQIQEPVDGLIDAADLAEIPPEMQLAL